MIHRLKNKGLGQGPNVILDLVESANILKGSEVFFDNLFTSFPLLIELSKINIQNRKFVKNFKSLA